MEKTLVMVVQNFTDGVVCMDIKGRCIYANVYARQVFHVDKDTRVIENYYRSWKGDRKPEEIEECSWQGETEINGKQNFFAARYRGIWDEDNRFIGCYYVLHDETEHRKKLEEERQNLVRVTDILSELTRQLEPLEKQSETARVYLSKRETLKELDVNMFLMEYAAAAKELKELEEKNIIAQNQLKDTQSSYDRTKVEYERLEQELEDLNSKMDALRISGQEQAIRKQQLEGQINVLNEQILAGAQNEEHYKGRIQTIEAELSVRTDSKKKLEEEKTDIYAQLKACLLYTSPSPRDTR